MLPMYIDYIKSNLAHDLTSLQGKTLVCDCEEGHLCEADILAGLVFEATSPSAAQPHPRAAGYPVRRVVRGPRRFGRALRFLQKVKCGVKCRV